MKEKIIKKIKDYTEKVLKYDNIIRITELGSKWVVIVIKPNDATDDNVILFDKTGNYLTETGYKNIND